MRKVVYFPFDTDNFYDTDGIYFYTENEIETYCKNNNLPGFVSCDALSLELYECIYIAV